jgi:dihydrofolate reductase
MMGKVITQLSMSLDGFVASPTDGVEHLFDWYFNGPVAVETPGAGGPAAFLVSEASADHVREMINGSGAMVAGRRLFDHTNGWGGSHPSNAPVFVVTHSVPEGWPREDAPFTFVTDGVESAIEQAAAVAGDKAVGVAGPNIAQQAINAGLIDEIRVDLVPVLLGRGIRFFDNLAGAPVKLDNPRIIEGDRVTHLYYRVVR